MNPTRRDVTIVSDNLPLAGWLYRPDPEPRSAAPVVVMAHGFSAVKEMELARYADILVAARFAVVVFDHPCFGASGGTPRQEVNPDRQLRAYRDVISWVAGIEGLDGDRVGVWGTSFSGGHALVLAATDRRVRAVVAQVPYVASGVDEAPAELLELLAADDEQVRRGADPLTIPVVTADPEGGGALSPDPAAYPFFTGLAASAPAWRNEVTLRSIARLFAYRPLDHAADVHAPTLVIGARDDVLSPFENVRAAASAIPAAHELLELPCGHFDVYEAYFGVTSEAAAGWFTRWLTPDPTGR